MKKSALLLLAVPFLLSGCIHTKKIDPPKPPEEHVYESTRGAKIWLTQGYSALITLFKMKGMSEDVPYVDVLKAYNNLYVLLASSYDPYNSNSYKLSASTSGDKVVLASGYSTFTFDVEEDTMTVSNINKAMLLLTHDSEKMIVASGLETSYVKVNDDLTQNINSNTSVAFNMGDYDIDLIKEKKTVYMPMATFNDLFMAINGIAFAYNGKDLYLTNSFNTSQSGIGAEDLELQYFEDSPWAGKQRSQELATFTYNEFCFALDKLYGLKDFRNITSFDALFEARGWKDDLLDTNPDVYELAMIDFVGSYLSEGHTRYTKISSFNYGTDYGLQIQDAQYANERYVSLLEARADLMADREELNQGIGLSICDNTAIIRFDQFVKAAADTSDINPDYSSYATLHETDTPLFFKKAFHDISQYSGIDNIVIDITCNGGGMLDSLPWLEAFMTDDPFLTIRNSLTGQITDTHYKVDLNQDGVFNENDTYKNQYKFFLLTSSFSFSCGNAFPTIVKKGAMATIIGEKSGGGACAVGALTTASGTVLRMSCTLQMGSLNDQNEFVINENGIEVDHELDRIYFYQNSSLKGFVNSL